MRYLITGGSGYIGSRLVDLLSRRDDTERIVICDVVPPRGYKPKTSFERLDVRDRDAVRSALERAKLRTPSSTSRSSSTPRTTST